MLSLLQSYKCLKPYIFMLAFVVSQSLALNTGVCQHQMSHEEHAAVEQVNNADSGSQNLHAHHDISHDSNISISNLKVDQPQDCCNSSCECAQNTCNSLQVLHFNLPNRIDFVPSNLMLSQTTSLIFSDFPTSLYRPPIFS